ncbi:MAG: hypothetical protein IPO62_16620 [Saprospiraceae bacterium]|nr:hypothetical protein [Saprospiraceae bacterium]
MNLPAFTQPLGVCVGHISLTASATDNCTLLIGCSEYKSMHTTTVKVYTVVGLRVGTH